MYDLIVIGGGPGGYTAALEARKLNKTVLIIEANKLGGVCLNSGCIPTKSLLNSSKQYAKSKKIEKFGVEIKGSKFNYSRAVDWKDSVVNKIRDNLSNLIERSGIEIIYGEGQILKNRDVLVDGKTYRGENIVIATGSSPIYPPLNGIENAITSNELLELRTKPEKLVIIGAGVIGMEFASFFSSIGTQVTVVEMEKKILPHIDKRLTQVLQKSLDVDFKLSATVTEIGKDFVIYHSKGEEIKIESDLVAIAIGRAPNVDDFENLGIVENRCISVNEFMETDIPGIYAVGDVTGISLLAHSAVNMAEVAVNNMFNSTKVKINKIVPWVVYSSPEIATVGITADSAKEQGIPVNKGIIHLSSNGRYLAENGEDKGVCIVISHKESHEILGIHIVGEGASEYISSGITAINKKMTIEEYRNCIFPHPTVGEVIKDSLV